MFCDHLPNFILQEVNVDPCLVRAVPVVAHLLGPGRPRLALAALAALSCGLVLGPDPRQQHTQQQQHPTLAAGYIFKMKMIFLLLKVSKTQ